MSTKLYWEMFKRATSPTTVPEIVEQIIVEHPDFFAKKDAAAAQQKRPNNGRKQIQAEVNSLIATGRIPSQLQVDRTGDLITFTYLEQDVEDADDDLLLEYEDEGTTDNPCKATRRQIVQEAISNFTPEELYRTQEFKRIADALKTNCGITLDVDHAKSLLNYEEPGEHHPDNLQLLESNLNKSKNNKNWNRFTWEQQERHLRCLLDAIEVAKNVNRSVFEILVQQLKVVYTPAK